MALVALLLGATPPAGEMRVTAAPRLPGSAGTDRSAGRAVPAVDGSRAGWRTKGAAAPMEHGGRGCTTASAASVVVGAVENAFRVSTALLQRWSSSPVVCGDGEWVATAGIRN